MKVNFKEFPMFQNLQKTEVLYFDLREQISDLLFKRGEGIIGHTLCHKIYESDGEIELDDKQAEYLSQFISVLCTVAMIESFNYLRHKKG